jgi:hypothetical protein
MQNKTIGFFGDSFCAEIQNHHSLWFDYDTYIKKLKEYYSAEIVNLGYGGSGIWDCYLNQLKPLIDKNAVPDISVFVWSLPGRLYHRKVRRLNSADSNNPKLHTFNPIYWKTWKAAKLFYQELFDWEKEELEYISALRYFDDEVLSKLPTKIIHLWATGKTNGWSNESVKPENVSYHYRWKSGVEIRPPLLGLSLIGHDIDILQTDHRANHFEGSRKNEMIYNWIRQAVDDYQPGTCLDFTSEVIKLCKL